MAVTINYPDVLGYITNDIRANVGLVQLATTIRPPVIRAGRAFEMLMLIQNASDVPLDVTVTLKLPQKDAKGKKGRIVTKAQRLVISLDIAGVGLVTLPVSTTPDTAVFNGYKIGMEVKVEPTSKKKPRRIRLAEGGEQIDFEQMDEERQTLFEELKKLRWSAEQRGNSLEATFMVMSGQVGQFADLKPSWTSLWTLADHVDDRLLFQRSSELFSEKILPTMTRRHIYPVVKKYVQEHFNKLSIKPIPNELELITRLLSLVLEYANMSERTPNYFMGEDLNIRRYLENDYLDNPANPVYLPYWASKLVHVINAQAYAADYPVRAICHFAFNELMHDAMLLAFNQIEERLGIDIGSMDERNNYALHVLDSIENDVLDFNLFYMPLVLGGVILGDRVLVKDEKPNVLLPVMRKMVDERYSLRNEDNEQTFEMTNTLVEQMANKYLGRNY